jgi:hypothetical protein
VVSEILTEVEPRHAEDEDCPDGNSCWCAGAEGGGGFDVGRVDYDDGFNTLASLCDVYQKISVKHHTCGVKCYCHSDASGESEIWDERRRLGNFREAFLTEGASDCLPLYLLWWFH